MKHFCQRIYKNKKSPQWKLFLNYVNKTTGVGRKTYLTSRLKHSNSDPDELK